MFPCRDDKRPATPHGFHDASPDPEQIRRWFTNPGYLLAIPTGRASGLVVVDVDGDDGWESPRGQERNRGTLPTTASVETRRGHHFYFKWPGVEVRNSASQVAPNIDVGGDGGYVVIPPSRGYEPDGQVAPIPLPNWLAQRICRGTCGTRTEPAEWVAMVRDGVDHGQRNHQLARLVGHLLRRDVNVDLTAELALWSMLTGSVLHWMQPR